MYWNSVFHSLASLGETSVINAAETIHTVPISIPPGTDYFWVARDGVDS